MTTETMIDDFVTELDNKYQRVKYAVSAETAYLQSNREARQFAVELSGRSMPVAEMEGRIEALRETLPDRHRMAVEV